MFFILINLFYIISKGFVSTEVDFISFEEFTSKGIVIDSFDVLHMKDSRFRFILLVDFYDVVIFEDYLKPFL